MLHISTAQLSTHRRPHGGLHVLSMRLCPVHLEVVLDRVNHAVDEVAQKHFVVQPEKVDGHCVVKRQLVGVQAKRAGAAFRIWISCVVTCWNDLFPFRLLYSACTQATNSRPRARQFVNLGAGALFRCLHGCVAFGGGFVR